MPPPTFSPREKQSRPPTARNTPPKNQPVTRHDRIIEKIRLFCNALKNSNNTKPTLNSITKEYVEKLQAVMNVEEFYFFQVT